jgi:hypothetical protein
MFLCNDDLETMVESSTYINFIVQDGKLFRIVTNKSEIEKGLFIKKRKREALFFQLELET